MRHRPDAIIHTAYVQSDWDVTATGAAHIALAVCPDVVVARTSLILGDGVSQHERLVHSLAARMLTTRLRGAREFV